MHDSENLRYIGTNKIINLSPKENELLEILIKNKEHIVSFDFLTKQLYPEAFSNKGVLLLVHRLRKKLKGEVIIKTKHRLGYII